MGESTFGAPTLFSFIVKIRIRLDGLMLSTSGQDKSRNICGTIALKSWHEAIEGILCTDGSKLLPLIFGPFGFGENMSLFPHPKTPHGNHRGTQRIFQSHFSEHIGTSFFRTSVLGFHFVSVTSWGAICIRMLWHRRCRCLQFTSRKLERIQHERVKKKSELHQLKTLCLWKGWKGAWITPMSRNLA